MAISHILKRKHLITFNIQKKFSLLLLLHTKTKLLEFEIE